MFQCCFLILSNIVLPNNHKIMKLLLLICVILSLFLFFQYIYIYIYIYACSILLAWRQHPTRHQLYGHLPPITKTIQVRRTRHPGHCWRSRDELISDVLLWTLHMAGQKQDNKLVGCPRDVMVKAMNCGIVVREFVLQSRYYVHFRANTLEKGMNPLILPPAMGK